MDYLIAEITHLVRTLRQIDALVNELNPQLRVDAVASVKIRVWQLDSWLKTLDSEITRHTVDESEPALRKEVVTLLNRAKQELGKVGTMPYSFYDLAAHLNEVWEVLMRARSILEEINFRTALSARKGEISPEEWQTGEFLEELNRRQEQLRAVYSIDLRDTPRYLGILYG